MVKYLVVHNKHEGCYDFQFYQDEVARIRLTSITINPPKIYMFNTRDEAQDFFEEYINDVDCIDIRCKRGDDVEHIDYCTCGVIELDQEENPILFYNRKNQIFLLEHGPELFVPPTELKNDIKNLNLTNRLIRKCRTLSREQRNKYIELGKYCQDCNLDEPDESDESESKNNIIKNISDDKKEVKPVSVIQITIPSTSTTSLPSQLTSLPSQLTSLPSQLTSLPSQLTSLPSQLTSLPSQLTSSPIQLNPTPILEQTKKPKTVRKKKDTEAKEVSNEEKKPKISKKKLENNTN
jgi:hypothetical protein